MQGGLPACQALVLCGEPGAIGNEEEPEKVDYQGVDNEEHDDGVLVLAFKFKNLL